MDGKLEACLVDKFMASSYSIMDIRTHHPYDLGLAVLADIAKSAMTMHWPGPKKESFHLRSRTPFTLVTLTDGVQSFYRRDGYEVTEISESSQQKPPDSQRSAMLLSPS